MTQEEKQLLLRDLCARLLYGVICCVIHKKNGELVKEDMKLSGIFEDGNCYFSDKMGSTYSDNYIPYLRSIPYMTEREREEYFHACGEDLDTLLHSTNESDIIISDKGRVQSYVETKELEWLLEHHFDFIRKVGDEYKTLIELGLAIEASNGIYKEQNEKVEH